MKVLLVTGSFPPIQCGVGDYSYNLAKALVVDSKINVGVLTSKQGAMPEKVEGLTVFPVIDGWRLGEILKVIRVVREYVPDIVHIQYPTKGYGTGKLPWLLPLLSFVMGKKVVQTWHGGYSNTVRDFVKFGIKTAVPGKLVMVYLRYEKNFHPQLHWALQKKKPVFIPNASSIPHALLDAQEKNALKRKYLKGQKRLIVFFGFVYHFKGVELIFKIANPTTDQIVIAGAIDGTDDYSAKIRQTASSEPWIGKVYITGFLPATTVAELLAVADAVILPFRAGGGDWNTSIHGAVLNGAFVITTSLTQHGYDKSRNVYYAKVDDVQEMAEALSTHAGTRRSYNEEIDENVWGKIAGEHCSLYKRALAE